MKNLKNEADVKRCYMKKAAERPVELRIQISISPPKGAFPAGEVRVWPPFLCKCLLVSPPAPPKNVEVSPRGGEEQHTAAVSPIF